MTGPPPTVVVGAGPWGLAAAVALRGAGHAVRLLDDGRHAAGHVAAGMLGPWSETEPGRPELRDELFRAAEAWPDFAADLSRGGHDAGFHPSGTIHVAIGGEQIGPLRRRAEQMARPDDDHRWLGGRDLRALDPGIGPGAGGGIHLPGEHQVDPRQLMAALAARAEQRGVVRVSAAAERIEMADGQARGVRDDTGALHPGHVVLAAGWRAGDLSARVPLRGVKGQIIRLRAPSPDEVPCHHVIRTGDVYIVPRPSGEVVIGATMEERTDRHALAGDVHRLLEDALRAVPGLGELPIVETSAGVRPAPVDGAPALGRDPDGVIWATGGFRHGVLLTPLVGPAVRAAVAGEPSAVPAWDPARFAPTAPSVTAPA